MFKFRDLFILIVGSIFVIVIMLLLNDIYINIRFKELKLHLQKINRNESCNDHIGLVTKYSLHKQIYDEKISQDKADSIEFKINLFSTRKESFKEVSVQKYEYLSIPALYIININRFFIGKSPIRDLEDKGESGLDLDLAYYYERNNLYDKAYQKYNEALKKGSYDETIISSIMLHQGFCSALLGEYERAKGLYLKIIEQYGSESVAITATILLRYLEGFQNEHKRILDKENDPIIKSEKLYRLLSYKKALEILNNLESGSKGQQQDRISYYKAGCYSGLGKSEKAIENYIGIITQSPKSEYAKLSNRRLYVVGTRMGNKSIKDASLKLNQVYNDKLLMEMAKNSARFDNSKTAIEGEKEIVLSPVLLKKIDRVILKFQNESYKGKNVSVNTIDGNIFKGRVIKYTDKYITISTIIGQVTIKRKKISKIKFY